MHLLFLNNQTQNPLEDPYLDSKENMQENVDIDGHRRTDKNKCGQTADRRIDRQKQTCAGQTGADGHVQREEHGLTRTNSYQDVACKDMDKQVTQTDTD
uniref:Uncharacterized protein n=1 Tax=Haemonchus contortus TaxID=6289 RepID=A0A7I4XYI9_HAECO